jgi:hypothetical protein
MFPKGTIFEKFPYLLPNFVCTVIVLCGLVIGILFLEETHAEKNIGMILVWKLGGGYWARFEDVQNRRHSEVRSW